MKPPISAVPTAGTEARRYLHRAGMFRDAALKLHAVVNGEQNLPAYALLLHSCELALKAFCVQSVENGHASARAPNHSLSGWYKIALGYGLTPDETVAQGIDVLDGLHASHYTRYPSDRMAQVPDISSIANEVVDRLIAAVSPTVLAG